MGKQDAQREQAAQAAEKPVSLDDVVAATQTSIEARADLMQMKMENETIMAECRVRPRSMEAIKRDLQDMLDLFPDLALQARYCKPCGKDDDGNQKEARGLSIRAAEVLAECYGYNRVRVDVTPLKDGLAKVDASFTDFQRCRIWQDGGIVSQFYKKNPRYAKFKDEMARIPDDRFWNVTCKAEASKRVREVILRSVNSALKKWFENECVKVASTLLDDDALLKIREYFKGLGIGLERLEHFVGRPKKLGWTVDDRLRLLELRNAIEEREITVETAFDLDGHDAMDADEEADAKPKKGLQTASGRSSQPAPNKIGVEFHGWIMDKIGLARDAGAEDEEIAALIKRHKGKWMADHSKDAAAVEAIQEAADSISEKLNSDVQHGDE